MKKLAMIALVSSLVACSGTPTLQSGSDAEYSHDGLVKVDNTRMDSVWVRPGIDLSNYDKIMVTNIGMQYRSVGEVNRLRMSSDSEFPMDEESQARFEEAVTETFREEMNNSERFELVQERGPTTLELAGGFIDVVSFVPPDDSPSRVDVYLTSLGAATLVLEVRDSASHQVFARAAEGRQFDVQTISRSNSVTNRFELERELEQWADLIREGVEYLGDTPMIPPVEE